MPKYLVRYTDCRIRRVIIDAENLKAIDSLMKDKEFFSKIDDTHITTTVDTFLSQITAIMKTIDLDVGNLDVGIKKNA